MSPYVLALLSLAFALLAQCTAAAIAAWAALRPPYRRTSMIFAVGLALLALHHGLTLELALHSGLFDLRQSLLAAGVSLLLLVGLGSGLKRSRCERPPPR